MSDEYLFLIVMFMMQNYLLPVFMMILLPDTSIHLRIHLTSSIRYSHCSTLFTYPFKYNGNIPQKHSITAFLALKLTL